MVSSGVWAGDIPLERAHNLKEVGNGTATMKSELERIGYLGETPASHKSIPMAAHFELHIEQGPILETTESKIGIVKGVQAYKWFTIEVHGRDTHTGTTPLERRADAMLAASKMILFSHRAATRAGARASTGILVLEPGSTNTVPGYVRFSLDIRAPEDNVVAEVEADCRKAFEDIAAGKDVDNLNHDCTPGLPCKVSIKVDSVSPAVKFHDDCISSVRSASEGLFGADKMEQMTKEMISGAGHDSVYTSYVCPTSMIFIPCRDGVSHNPREYSTPDDCALGAQVLMQSVLRYDKLRAEKERHLS
jgi:hydantoinase/carbamoylase family amidase